MAKITVFLADWQVLFREGIHFTLSGEEDIDVIGEATSSEEAFKEIQASPPGVAVLNANHEEMGGIRVAGRLKQSLPAVSVLLIMDSNDDERRFLEQAMDPVAIDIMKQIKDILDPRHILNPGKIWEETPRESQS